MQIHIEASELPGRTCGPDTDFAGFDNIHVGVQRKDRPGELLGMHPGDAAHASWTLDCTAVSTTEGVEVSGPYIQNRLGGASPICPGAPWTVPASSRCSGAPS